MSKIHKERGTARSARPEETLLKTLFIRTIEGSSISRSINSTSLPLQGWPAHRQFFLGGFLTKSPAPEIFSSLVFISVANRNETVKHIYEYVLDFNDNICKVSRYNLYYNPPVRVATTVLSISPVVHSFMQL